MSNRKNVFLDLDNTLISSTRNSPEAFKNATKYDSYDFIDSYITVARPHLQQFLDYLFKHHNVCVWTAASRSYAVMIIKKFILKLDPSRQLGMVLHKDHVNTSMEATGGSKSLRLLWETWKIPGYSQDNTYIIDDLDEVCSNQPNNCLRIKGFDFMRGDQTKDRELLSMMERVRELV